MTHVGDCHNLFRANGDSTYSKHFGPLLAVTPVSLTSAGHRQTIAYAFKYGAHIELTPEDAAALIRGTQEALVALPVLPNCSGALAELGDVS